MPQLKTASVVGRLDRKLLHIIGQDISGALCLSVAIRYNPSRITKGVRSNFLNVMNHRDECKTNFLGLPVTGLLDARKIKNPCSL